MIQIAGSQLCQWDVGRSVNISDSKATHVHFANQGDSKAVIIEITNGTAKIPDYLLQTGKALNAYAVLDGVTLESRSFAVCKRERPENYVYEDDRRNYIYELITSAEDAVENANQAAQNANEAAEKLGSIVIPTKVSQLQNDSGFLTEAPVTSVNGQTGAVTVPTAVQVQVWQKNDGSYDYSHNSLRIMNALSAGSTVFCQLGTHYLLSLVYATPAKCIFTGVYEGELYAVTVTSTGATVSTTPLSSGGSGADGLYFDETTGTLYLLQNGQILGNGVQLPTTGDAPTNNAVLTLENTSGWSTKTISNVHPTCIISVNWSSVDGGVSTGTGTVTVKVENELRYSANIKQGAYRINVIDYLRLGENRVDLTITDFRGNSKSVLFIVSMYDPEALISKKLVEKTLTGDYTNDRVTKVGSNAFSGLKLGKLSLPNVTGDIGQSFANLIADEVELDSVESTAYRMVNASTIGVMRLPNVTQIGDRSDFRANKVERMVFNRLEDFGSVKLNAAYTNVVTFDFHKLKSLPNIPNSSLLSNLIIRTPDTVCTLQSVPESTKVKLYVPESLVEQYKVATNWSSMADRIFAIEDNLDFCGGE